MQLRRQRKGGGERVFQEPVGASDSSSARPGRRVLGVDAVKFMAAVGIVAFHMGSRIVFKLPGVAAGPLVTAAFRWGVPVFFIAAGYLHALGMPKASGARWLGRRAVRLYGMYAAWTAIYVVAGLIIEPGRPNSLMGLLLLGGNFGLHLWFLPVLILVSAIGTLLKSRASRLTCLAICLTIFSAHLGGWRLPGDSLLGYGAPFSHWLLLYCAGMLIFDYRPPSRLPRNSSPIWILMLAVGGSALLALVAFGMRSEPGALRALTGFGIGSTIALLMFLLSLEMSVSSDSRVTSVFCLSIGVYLIHPMVRAVYGRVIPPASVNPFAWMIVGFLVVLGVSMAASFLLRTQRVTRWLVS